MKKLIPILSLILLLASLQSNAQVDTDIEIIQFASGLDKPVDITNAGDDRMFVVEKDGQIRILNSDGTVNPTSFLNMQSLTETGGNNDEQGCLGLAFHPNYQENGYFYVNYTRVNGNTRISRFTVSDDPDVADLSSREDIIDINQPYWNHNGGCLRFGPDGYLYIGMGDGGSGEDPDNYGQNMGSLLGKMLRIDVDVEEGYVVPSDNPFVGTSNDTLPEIWASGLRNPWRFDFDPASGDLWIADVGQYSWEEIDFQPASSTGGENYGWRCYEGNHNGFGSGCPPMDEFTGAVAEFSHNDGHCSITGGVVYRGNAFPNLNAKYLSVDYCSGQFWSTELNDADQFVTFEITSPEGFGWSGFGRDVYGEMYVLHQSQGRVYKIIDDNCEDNEAEWTADFNYNLTATEGLSYQWYLNGQPIAGAIQQNYQATENGNYSVFVQFSEFCGDYSPAVQVNITSLEEQADIFGAAITQNPVSDRLELSFGVEQSIGLDITIFDAMGRPVERTFISRGAQVNRHVIDVAGLATGRYHLELSNEKGRTVLPFVIAR